MRCSHTGMIHLFPCQSSFIELHDPAAVEVRLCSWNMLFINKIRFGNVNTQTMNSSTIPEIPI